MEYCGYQVGFSEYLIAGCTNIVIECFDQEFVFQAKQALLTPGTRLFVIATEFITHDTFNDFEKAEPPKGRSLKPQVSAKQLGRLASHFFFPASLRRLIIKTIPTPYFKARDYYYSIFGFPQTSDHKIKSYWHDRFSHFTEIAAIAEKIFCVTSHQIPEYCSRFGNSRVELLPIVSWTSETSSAQSTSKDIDFLFTGSLTPYRDRVFQELRKMGYSVKVGPADWPAFLREHFLSRAKICLHVRQDPTWKFPSVMRYHYLLSRGALVVAERCSQHCFQEQFLISCDPDQFIQTCVTALAAGDWLDRGIQAQKNYFAVSEKGREALLKIFKEQKRNLPDSEVLNE